MKATSLGEDRRPLRQRLENFRISVLRHGAALTLLRHANDLLRRVLRHEICRIESSSADFSDLPDPLGYESRRIEEDQFHRHLCAELRDYDFHNAFANGDICIATLKDDEVVGFTFYTDRPAAVNGAITFKFPKSFIYGYASRTAPSHRGKGLESSRWKAEQIERIGRTGVEVPRIFYIDVMNLESRAANRGHGNKLLGYSGYGCIAGRWFCFRTPGCRRTGTGFYKIHAQGSPPE